MRPNAGDKSKMNRRKQNKTKYSNNQTSMEGLWAVTEVSRPTDWVRVDLIRHHYRGNCECNGSYSSYETVF